MARSTLYRLAQNGKFPKPRRLGEGLSRWALVELEEYDKAVMDSAPVTA